MVSWSRWAGIGVAVGICGALLPVVQGKARELDLGSALSRLELRSERRVAPPLDGLDLTRLTLLPRRVVSPLGEGRVAELTLDPELQRTASSVMSRYHLPEAGVVLMKVKTGDLLVYASHVAKGDGFDVNVRAEPPAASVFKVITGAALVESAGLNAATEQCYHGGKSRISMDELEDDPRRDKWCASLATAMGRSLNVVFARLARKHLTPESLASMAGAFGFGAPVPFVVENEAPTIEIPPDPVEFARTAAGFWNTTLSPLAAVSIAQTVANEGVTLAPRIVTKVLDGKEAVWESPSDPVIVRRAVTAKTANEVRVMMKQTVANGSAYKAFHDKRGRAYLPGISVAGKTGTLTRHKANRHYTWFVGFAPADRPEVAVAALIVNTPTWRIKAHQLAQSVLRAYFAKQGAPGVNRP